MYTKATNIDVWIFDMRRVDTYAVAYLNYGNFGNMK